MACSLMGVEGGVAAILGGTGVDVNAQDELGMSALIAASVKGHTGIVSVLLQAGADPNLARKVGWTLSHAKGPPIAHVAPAPVPRQLCAPLHPSLRQRPALISTSFCVSMRVCVCPCCACACGP